MAATRREAPTRGYTASKEAAAEAACAGSRGQVRGVEGMVEDDRYCIDVLDPDPPPCRQPSTRSPWACSTSTPATRGDGRRRVGPLRA